MVTSDSSFDLSGSSLTVKSVLGSEAVSLAVTQLASATRMKIMARLSMSVGGRQFCFSSARSPTLSSLEPLRPWVPPHLWEAVLHPLRGITPAEAAKGNSFSYTFVDSGGRAATGGVQEMSAAFDGLIQPCAWSVSTRGSYWDAWRMFLCFAFSLHWEANVLPASTELLKAFSWHLVRLQYAPSSVGAALSAIVNRHLVFGLPSPLQEGEMGMWLRAVKVLNAGCGKKALTTPILTEHLKALMVLPHASLQQVQDMCIVALGTLIGNRPGALADLDLCDLLFGDAGSAVALTVNVKEDKTDRARRGHFPRLGWASQARFCVVAWLKSYFRHAGLFTHLHCKKSSSPRATCTLCGRLFRRIVNGRILPSSSSKHCLSVAMITTAVRRAMARIGESSPTVSGKSLRYGNVSTGARHALPQYIMAAQSGHAVRAGQASYINTGAVAAMDPSSSLAVFRAFNL